LLAQRGMAQDGVSEFEPCPLTGEERVLRLAIVGVCPLFVWCYLGASSINSEMKSVSVVTVRNGLSSPDMAPS